MKAAWAELIAKTHPGGVGAAVPGLNGHYPILGEELPLQACESFPSSSWKIRLALCSTPTDEQLHALTEDVEEIRLGAECKALVEHASLRSSEIYLDFQDDQEQAWSRLEHHVHSDTPLPGWRTCWGQGQRRTLEQTFAPDSLVLRNIALLGKLRHDHPEVERWVVRSSASATSAAEGLICDTLGYLTGVLCGAQVLEVEQQPGEGFETLWSRLNILRLLRWEADLGNGGDIVNGAGAFAVLSGLAPTQSSS